MTFPETTLIWPPELAQNCAPLETPRMGHCRHFDNARNWLLQVEAMVCNGLETDTIHGKGRGGIVRNPALLMRREVEES